MAHAQLQLQLQARKQAAAVEEAKRAHRQLWLQQRAVREAALAGHRVSGGRHMGWAQQARLRRPFNAQKTNAGTT